MNIRRLIILCVLLLGGISLASENDNYKSLQALNSDNLAVRFERYLGYLYESQGCLHFTPSDIYLLTQSIPKGTPLQIRPYSNKPADIDLSSVRFFNQMINSREDLEKAKDLFKTGKTKLVVYPSWGRLVILVDDSPFAQVRLLAGMPHNLRLPVYIEKGGPIIWDPMISGPTDAGDYSILASVKNYKSVNYRDNTIIPFGSVIKYENGRWMFNNGNIWSPVPKNVAADLSLPKNERNYNYYDIVTDNKGTIISLKWASNDFGKYVLLWTNNGKQYYPEMGYAEGELLYEQSALVEDLAGILTYQGGDDFEELVAKNENFMFYKALNEFIESNGTIKSAQIDDANAAYFKLFNGWPLSNEDIYYMDKRVVDAFNSMKKGELPFFWLSQEETRGLYQFLRLNSMVFKKYAGFYKNTKEDWEFWKGTRKDLKDDLKALNILSTRNQKDIAEYLINARLEFWSLSPNVLNRYQRTSISTFFDSQKEDSVFSEREKEALTEILSSTGAASTENITLYSMDALNDYNFGILLNDMLGNLYKSHGCLHVSPRDSYLLYSILPVNTKIKINGYDKKADTDLIEKTPFLASLVDFEEDVKKLKEKFGNPKDVFIEVYPMSGDWIIFLDKSPFARLRVLGGPRKKMLGVTGRDIDGRPSFSEDSAYPTTPGIFYVLRKDESYISNLYRDTTIVPMGALIKKENGKWTFEDAAGKKKSLPAVIAADLSKKPDERDFQYYDLAMNDKNEIIKARWGSHEFGKYSIITSKNKRTPSPELIHTSGDLMMEQRQLVKDLIKILSAPKDSFDECVSASSNFDLYRECYNFVSSPEGNYLITPAETGRYKLYFDMPLSSKEVSFMPKDAVIAEKIIKNKGPLTRTEEDLLVEYGIARRSGNKLNINMEKIYGIDFETFQNVVVIQKYAHHYEVLRARWPKLSQMRKAMFLDFKKLLVKDPGTLSMFMNELMIQRVDMKRISQADVVKLLNSILDTKAN